MDNEEKVYYEEKEDNTMAAMNKPTECAFVLNPQKADAFLKQDNSQFKNIMAKFEKFTRKGHSIPGKK